MCDEYGLYVVDEANIASHGRGYDLPITSGNEAGRHPPLLCVGNDLVVNRQLDRIEWADSLLNFAALPHSPDDLDPEENKKQYHSGELVERPETYLRMHLQQTGLQGIDTWGAWPVEQYRIPYAKHRYSYYIRPVR